MASLFAWRLLYLLLPGEDRNIQHFLINESGKDSSVEAVIFFCLAHHLRASTQFGNLTIQALQAKGHSGQLWHLQPTWVQSRGWQLATAAHLQAGSRHPEHG